MNSPPTMTLSSARAIFISAPSGRFVAGWGTTRLWRVATTARARDAAAIFQACMQYLCVCMDLRGATLAAEISAQQLADGPRAAARLPEGRGEGQSARRGGRARAVGFAGAHAGDARPARRQRGGRRARGAPAAVAGRDEPGRRGPAPRRAGRAPGGPERPARQARDDHGGGARDGRALRRVPRGARGGDPRVRGAARRRGPRRCSGPRSRACSHCRSSRWRTAALDERPLQVDRAVERHARRAARDARRLDRADRDAGHLPRHPPRSAGARRTASTCCG